MVEAMLGNNAALLLAKPSFIVNQVSTCSQLLLGFKSMAAGMQRIKQRIS